MRKTLLSFLMTLACLTAISQQKALTIKDYPKWSRIVTPTLSNDGKWFAYAHRPNGGDDTLIIKNLDADKQYKIKFAQTPRFSEDSKWVTYTTKPSKEEDKKLKKNKKPVFNTAWVMNAETGEKTCGGKSRVRNVISQFKLLCRTA
jgi:Tol biopolymer transport system component